MKRIAGLFLAVAVTGCGTTLPSEDSVILTISKATVTSGEEIGAILVNASTEVIGLGILPCTSQIIDSETLEPIAPPNECVQPLMLMRAGTRTTFDFTAPTASGTYRLEIHTQAPYADAGWGALDVRSAVFTVSGAEPASR